MSLQSTTLGLLLQSDSQEQKLAQMEKLKSQYFSGLFSSVYRSVNNFYEAHARVPSFEELKLFNSRNSSVLHQVLALEKVELPDVPISLQLEQLEAEHIQHIAIEKLDKFADNLPLLGPQEIVEELQAIQMLVEEEIDSSDKVFYGNEISMFRAEEETQTQFSTLGLSERWDMEFLGGKEEELILLGGYRGVGKSALCINICAHHWMVGKIAPYCTIEMTAEETYQRFWQTASGVRFSALRNGTMNHFEQVQLQLSQAAQYEGGFDYLMDQLKALEEPPTRDLFQSHETYFKQHLKQILPIVVIDDRNLKISTIDLVLTTLKAKYPGIVTTVIVDYVNQLILEGVKTLDRLDWKVQTQLATMLKNTIARKQKVLVISPYQVDENGATRMQKGLLDQVDMQFTINKSGSVLTLTVAKLRNLPAGINFVTHMSWDYMKIIPQSIVKVPQEEQGDE